MDYSYSRNFHDKRSNYSQIPRNHLSNFNQIKSTPQNGNSVSMVTNHSLTEECSMVNSFEKNLSHFPLGMTYTPMQNFTQLYSPNEGLQAGTIFKELDFPFMVGNCARRYHHK